MTVIDTMYPIVQFGLTDALTRNIRRTGLYGVHQMRAMVERELPASPAGVGALLAESMGDLVSEVPF